MSGRGTPLAGNGPAWAFVSPGVWDSEQSRDTNAETMSESVGLSGTRVEGHKRKDNGAANRTLGPPPPI